MRTFVLITFSLFLAACKPTCPVCGGPPVRAGILVDSGRIKFVCAEEHSWSK